MIVTNQDDCSSEDPAFFGLDVGKDDGGASDFRCATYGYLCDEPITPDAATRTLTHCKPRSGADSLYLRDTSFYADFLGQLKDPSRVVVAAISGGDAQGNIPDPSGFTIQTGTLLDPDRSPAQDAAVLPSCESAAMTGGEPLVARPGLRLADFVTRLGDRGSYYTACQADYAQPLLDFTNRVADTMSPCLEGAIDPTTCTVDFVQGDARQPVAPCPSAGPCWSLESDPTTCADTARFPTRLAVKIVNGAAPAGALTSVTCAVTGP